MSEDQEASKSMSVDVAYAALAHLGVERDSVESIDVLETLWGAGGYRVHLRGDGTRILKATRPDAIPHLVEGAKREVLFYRRLADRMPVRVPHVFGAGLDEEAGAMVLMQNYAPAPPAESWSHDMFLRAAADLGRFHAAFWGRGEELRALGFTSRPTFVEAEDQAQHARECWEYLGAKPKFQGVLTAERLRVIEGWIETVPQTQALLAALPETLIHGDCHVGNVRLDEDGSLVWTDWQGVRIGRGPEDIAFLYLRIDRPEGRVPYDNMLSAYHTNLGTALGEAVSLHEVRQAAFASEWAVRVLQVPHYMDGASADQMRALVHRLEDLALSLGIG